jgi:2-dehydro-3-deoxyphosphogalactonate aldolase
MNTPLAKFQTAMRDLPLVAILRGLTPAEAPIIGDALVEIGFQLLEVRLNSPQPLESIALLQARFPQALVGAGTVLRAQDVREVAAVGGELIVAPNFNLEVVAEATRLRLASLPSVMTPTEAFGALAAGATGLKLFPAEMASPSVVKALLAVLPPGTKLIPVGGISAGNIPAWRAAGGAGFGLGSSLFRPGDDVPTVQRKASALVAAYRAGASAPRGEASQERNA